MKRLIIAAAAAATLSGCASTFQPHECEAVYNSPISGRSKVLIFGHRYHANRYGKQEQQLQPGFPFNFQYVPARLFEANNCFKDGE